MKDLLQKDKMNDGRSARRMRNLNKVQGTVSAKVLDKNPLDQQVQTKNVRIVTQESGNPLDNISSDPYQNVTDGLDLLLQQHREQGLLDQLKGEHSQTQTILRNAIDGRSTSQFEKIKTKKNSESFLMTNAGRTSSNFMMPNLLVQDMKNRTQESNAFSGLQIPSATATSTNNFNRK